MPIRVPFHVVMKFETPLNGILGDDATADARQTSKSDLSLPARQTIPAILLRLLNDILDLQKSKPGKWELSYAAFSPQQIADETTALLMSMLETRG